MSGHGGQVMNPAQAANALAEPASWEPAAVRRGPAEPAADWTGLERMEQVVVRQRRYLVRDIVAAVAFAALSIAVVVALL
ncbi:MAG: hypothetical protein HY906_02545 [Deltaproteobacteria bacterium]|nr:hypothetical protein [Deltaproteobacteria bacterium]